MVLGILGLFVPVLAPLAIWQSCRARTAMAGCRTLDGGRSATAGLVLGILGTVWLALLLVAAVSGGIDININSNNMEGATRTSS